MNSFDESVDKAVCEPNSDRSCCFCDQRRPNVVKNLEAAKLSRTTIFTTELTASAGTITIPFDNIVFDTGFPVDVSNPLVPIFYGLPNPIYKICAHIQLGLDSSSVTPLDISASLLLNGVAISTESRTLVAGDSYAFNLNSISNVESQVNSLAVMLTVPVGTTAAVISLPDVDNTASITSLIYLDILGMSACPLRGEES